jgi:hypothetical protein
MFRIQASLAVGIPLLFASCIKNVDYFSFKVTSPDDQVVNFEITDPRSSAADTAEFDIKQGKELRIRFRKEPIVSGTTPLTIRVKMKSGLQYEFPEVDLASPQSRRVVIEGGKIIKSEFFLNRF